MTVFEMNLSLPADPELAPMLRGLAVQGARQAGCADADAEDFGRRVEDAARENLGSAGADGTVPVSVRHVTGPVEVVIGACCVSITP